jgi:hypothetical protein
MSEGPLNFGKPLLYLTILGCAGAGYWFYKNWPVHAEGQGWSVDMPNKWQADPQLVDDQGVPRVYMRGPLADEIQGAGQVSWVLHGTVDWPAAPLKMLPMPPDSQEDRDIDYKKALLFTFTQGSNRFQGVVIDRNDAYVAYWLGCATSEFDKNQKKFQKSVLSLKVQR